MRQRQVDCLEADLEGIESFLEEFDVPANGELRSVQSNATGELVIVRNFPLPDEFRPDYVDVLLMTHNYPGNPPVGIYLLQKDNADVIAQLRRMFNVMNRVPYGAPTVDGYAWICVIYAGNTWRFNRHDIARGDNLRKFLIHFYNECHAGVSLHGH